MVYKECVSVQNLHLVLLNRVLCLFEGNDRLSGDEIEMQYCSISACVDVLEEIIISIYMTSVIKHLFCLTCTPSGLQFLFVAHPPPTPNEKEGI